MKTDLEIFSSEKLKDFFINLKKHFNISLRNLYELENSYNSNKLSIVFFDEQDSVEDKVIKKICQNKNFIFISREFSKFEKSCSGMTHATTSPLPISKFLDMINASINTKKQEFKNISLKNHIATNADTNEKIHLTQAENAILFKLFNEVIVNKKILARDALHIKENLNTSSIESHLNRIRKKLKKINSCFVVSTKDQNVFLEIINQDK